MHAAALVMALMEPGVACAVTTHFFDSSQATNLVASGATSETLSSEGYLFTFTRDKLFTGGGGLPIGRAVRVPWPDGLEAQAVTAGPTTSGAKIVVRREDGQLFAIESFTAKLLANTAGAGAAIEVMPLLNGEDGVPNPFMYDATGFYGGTFPYDTPELAGFDTYQVTLYVDFALMSLTVRDASPPPPTLALFQVDAATFELSWPTNAAGYSLKSATNMPAVFWDPVLNPIVTNADLCTVLVEITGSQKYFQLRK